MRGFQEQLLICEGSQMVWQKLSSPSYTAILWCMQGNFLVHKRSDVALLSRVRSFLRHSRALGFTLGDS